MKYLISVILIFSMSSIYSLNKYPVTKKQWAKFGKMKSYRISIYEGSKRKLLVKVFEPKGQIKADILVLPGWNFKWDSWVKYTDLVEIASKKGFRLILPNVRRILYGSRYFKESRRTWLPKPAPAGMQWIKQFFLPAMQKNGYLLQNKNNFVMGLSTGGRGAMLVAINNPHLFRGVASLSGDFNQAAMPRDKLMTNLYGSYYKHKKRWREVDNMHFVIDKWNLPLYLGHGDRDPVVPFSQTQNYYNALKKVLQKKKSNLDVIFHVEKKGKHNYLYWRKEVLPVLNFFEKHLK